MIKMHIRSIFNGALRLLEPSVIIFHYRTFPPSMMFIRFEPVETPVHYHLSLSFLFKCVLIFNPQSKLRVQGENIYVRHSNLMLEVRMSYVIKNKKTKESAKA